jgi:thioester reductase-like protein
LTTRARGGARIAEDDALASCAGLSGGYPQSKFVADRLVTLAAARGLSTCVVRPGYIGGDAERGVWNVDDFLCRLLKGCVQLGAAPSIADAAVLDVTPVNVVADIVVAAALGDSKRNINVVNPQRFRFAALFQGLRDFGYVAESLPYATWRQRLLESDREERRCRRRTDATREQNALAPLLSVLTPTWADALVGRLGRVYEKERLLQVCKCGQHRVSRHGDRCCRSTFRLFHPVQVCRRRPRRRRATRSASIGA